jgi:hypothetical protein
MTIEAPEGGVAFHCECNTVPSKDVYKTMTETLDALIQSNNPPQLLSRQVVVSIGLGVFFGSIAARLIKLHAEASSVSRIDVDLTDAAIQGGAPNFTSSPSRNLVSLSDSPSANAMRVANASSSHVQPAIQRVTLAVTTWNMQGFTNFAAGFRQLVQNARSAATVPGIDQENQYVVQVISLQEAGDLAFAARTGTTIPLIDANGATAAHTWSYNAGSEDRPITFETLSWENTWAQGGLGILSNLIPRDGRIGRINPLTPPTVPVVPRNPRAIPWMTISLPDSHSTEVTILTLHAPPAWVDQAGNGLTQDQVVTYVRAHVQDIATSWTGRSWILLGDFNVQPNILGDGLHGIQDAHGQPLALRVVHGDDATHREGAILDYAVTNIAGLSFTSVASLPSGSDHFPQTFILRLQ